MSETIIVEGTWAIRAGSPASESPWGSWAAVHGTRWEPFAVDAAGTTRWRRLIPKAGFSPDFYDGKRLWDVAAFLGFANVRFADGEVETVWAGDYVVEAYWHQPGLHERVSLLGCTPDEFACRLEWASRDRAGWWPISGALVLRASYRETWSAFVQSATAEHSPNTVRGMVEALFEMWSQGGLGRAALSSPVSVGGPNLRSSVYYGWPGPAVYEVRGETREQALLELGLRQSDFEGEQ